MNRLYILDFWRNVHLVCHTRQVPAPSLHGLWGSFNSMLFLSPPFWVRCSVSSIHLSFSYTQCRVYGHRLHSFFLLQVTLFVEIQSGIRRRAVVGLVRWDVARQTQTLVGAFCVDALGILAERHPIIQLAAFIYICNKPNHGSASRRHASTICTWVLPTALGHINQTVSSFLPLFNMQE